MNAEINRLKSIIDSTRNDATPWLATALEKLGSELFSVFSVPGKLVGNIVRGVSSLFKKK